MQKNKWNKDKMKQFNELTLKEYNQDLIIEKIVKVELVKETDGSFIQLGLRPLVEDDIFRKFKDVEVYPNLPGLGRHIAIGERDFLIKNILDNKKIKRKILNKEKLLNFPSSAYEFSKATILISLDFFVELSQKLAHRIKYEKGKTILDNNYNLDFIPGEMMKNKIIIISPNAILWQKEKFFNEFTKTEEKIDIQINSASANKADILVRSVNKIKNIDPELIKIIEVRNK
jgi:hypothetical protein